MIRRDVTRLDWLVCWGPVCSRSVSLFRSTWQPLVPFLFIHNGRFILFIIPSVYHCFLPIGIVVVYVFLVVHLYLYRCLYLITYLFCFFKCGRLFATECFQHHFRIYVSPSQIFWSLSIFIIVALRDVFPMQMRNIRQFKREWWKMSIFFSWHLPEPLRNSADVWQWVVWWSFDAMSGTLNLPGGRQTKICEPFLACLGLLPVPCNLLLQFIRHVS